MEFSGVVKTSSQRLPPLGTFQPQVTLFYVQPGAQLCRPYPLPGPPGQMAPLCYPCTAGFIDFIVEPTFSVLTDVAEKSVQPMGEEDSKSKTQPR